MTTTHTPGPWTAGTKSGKAPHTIYGSGLIIAHVDTSAAEPGENAANARLIAQAPAMLAAWQSVFDLDLDDAIETYIPYPTKVRYRVVLDKARAILRVVEG